MTVDVGIKATRGPGRPRSERSHKAVLEATLKLLAEEGFRGLTVEAVAAKSGVARTTIYRWWPTKLELAREAYFGLAMAAPVPMADSTREAVVAHLRRLIELARDPIAARIGGDAWVEALRNPELDEVRQRLVDAYQAPLREALERAVARDEVRADLDHELTMDLFTGPIVLRALATRGPLEPELAEHIADAVLDGVGPLRG